ncbi:MAG: peptide deformylase, partial [Thermoleophilia bacterium]
MRSATFSRSVVERRSISSWSFSRPSCVRTISLCCTVDPSSPALSTASRNQAGSIGEPAMEVERAEGVVVEGLDLSGRPVTIEATGLMARILQHEIDHL